MNRILVVLVLGLTMFSCGDLTKAPEHRPTSGGGVDEVMVVADDAVWKKHLEEPVTAWLNKDFEVLPQYEPAYKFGYVNYDALKGLIKQHRNLVIFADLTDNSEVTELVKTVLGEEYTAKALSNPDFSYAIKHDLWSKPQIVFFVFAATPEQLVANIVADGGIILDSISKHEVREKYTLGLYLPQYNVELTEKIKTALNINLRMPPEYFLALEKPNFLWFRWEPKESSNNVFVYTEALPDSIDSQRPIFLRDSLGKAYVSSKLDSAYMITDTIIDVVQRRISINGYEALETRGLWYMEHDFMAGPFINYYILDKANNRAVMLDGFVFSPKGHKKLRIRFMEALFATFEQKNK
jgi:hypothetical protein